MPVFPIQFQPGQPVYEQIVYAAKKAMVSGQLRPGDRFPSVRQLSQDFKINPNTAHKVVAILTEEGLLEVQPGIGTVIAPTSPPKTDARRALLADEVERLVVEALKLSLDLKDVTGALQDTWERISKGKS